MSDSTKEFVKPSAEATIPLIHPDASPHVETVHDMVHLGRIHAELSGEGAETTGELTQVPMEPQIINSSQFEVPESAAGTTPSINRTGTNDDTSLWQAIYKSREAERGELKHAA